jgi:hypothetical protein
MHPRRSGPLCRDPAPVARQACERSLAADDVAATAGRQPRRPRAGDARAGRHRVARSRRDGHGRVPQGAPTAARQASISSSRTFPTPASPPCTGASKSSPGKPGVLMFVAQRNGYLGGGQRIFTAAACWQAFANDPHPALERLELRTGDAACHATRELLLGPEPPTALVTGQNLITIGALRALRDHSLQQTIAPLAVDDIPLSDVVQPGITVIAQDPFAGRHASPNPDDDRLVARSRAAAADWLVSGDRHRPGSSNPRVANAARSWPRGREAAGAPQLRERRVRPSTPSWPRSSLAARSVGRVVSSL